MQFLFMQHFSELFHFQRKPDNNMVSNKITQNRRCLHKHLLLVMAGNLPDSHPNENQTVSYLLSMKTLAVVGCPSVCSITYLCTRCSEIRAHDWISMHPQCVSGLLTSVLRAATIRSPKMDINAKCKQGHSSSLT